jgi:hypothetical protein
MSMNRTLVVSLLVALSACAAEESDDVVEDSEAIASFAKSIQNVWSGKCMDVPWGATATGTAVNKFPCHGGPAQQFEIVTDYAYSSTVSRVLIRKVGTNQCVTPTPVYGSWPQSTNLELAPCYGGAYQQTTMWLMTSSAISGGLHATFQWAQDASYCLDNALANDSTPMVAYHQCHGGTTQQFEIRN